jgi:hypothetical protein
MFIKEIRITNFIILVIRKTLPDRQRQS